MKLITKRCEIRNFTEAEEEPLFSLLSDPAVMAFLEPPYSREKAREFLNACGLSQPPLIYAVWGRGNGRLLGYVIYHPWEEGCWELGWVLFPRYWGIGLARELTRELIAFSKARHIPELVIQCVPEQAATRRLAEYFGFLPGEASDRCRLYRLKL